MEGWHSSRHLLLPSAGASLCRFDVSLAWFSPGFRQRRPKLPCDLKIGFLQIPAIPKRHICQGLSSTAAVLHLIRFVTMSLKMTAVSCRKWWKMVPRWPKSLSLSISSRSTHQKPEQDGAMEQSKNVYMRHGVGWRMLEAKL